jgi:hypothetical protein
MHAPKGTEEKKKRKQQQEQQQKRLESKTETKERGQILGNRRERERLSNRKKSNNISKRKAKRVKLHPKTKNGLSTFNFLFHKMEYIDVCAINQSFCFFISLET